MSKIAIAMQARSAVRLRWLVVSSRVTTRYDGTAATGSTMKRTEVKVIRAN
jgi:hypothetical protein